MRTEAYQASTGGPSGRKVAKVMAATSDELRAVLRELPERPRQGRYVVPALPENNGVDAKLTTIEEVYQEAKETRFWQALGISEDKIPVFIDIVKQIKPAPEANFPVLGPVETTILASTLLLEGLDPESFRSRLSSRDLTEAVFVS